MREDNYTTKPHELQRAEHVGVRVVRALRAFMNSCQSHAVLSYPVEMPEIFPLKAGSLGKACVFSEK